jgi:hypothetical protein
MLAEFLGAASVFLPELRPVHTSLARRLRNAGVREA